MNTRIWKVLTEDLKISRNLIIDEFILYTKERKIIGTHLNMKEALKEKHFLIKKKLAERNVIQMILDNEVKIPLNTKLRTLEEHNKILNLKKRR